MLEDQLVEVVDAVRDALGIAEALADSLGACVSAFADMPEMIDPDYLKAARDAILAFHRSRSILEQIIVLAEHG